MPKKLIVLAVLLALLFTWVHAQKLPNKQEANVALPANLKINGKADEWNNQFQAYNSTTQLKYTIANDGNNIYIVVNANDRDVVQKIGLFGITVTVSPSSKPDSKVSLTYPAARISNLMPLPSITMTEAIVASTNRNFSSEAKTMKITGVKDITEGETSIYNEFDIRAAAAIDAQRNYTCEFLIPLKYLGLAGQSGAGLRFDIQINGPSEKPWPNQIITQLPDGKYTSVSSPDDGAQKSITVDFRVSTFVALTQSFNFSGEYKLK